MHTFDSERITVEEARLLLKYIREGYDIPDVIYDTIKDVCIREIEEKKKVVIIKRDPNVTRGRIQARYVKIVDGNTIEMHPCTVGPFGADFDGDSVYCHINISRDGIIHTIHISDLLDSFGDDFEETSTSTKSNGIVVQKFKPKEKNMFSMLSISPDTGEISEQPVSEYSIHHNLNMYSVSHPKFETFWASSDHSLIVYDEHDDSIKKIDPEELRENPEGKYLIKKI